MTDFRSQVSAFADDVGQLLSVLTLDEHELSVTFRDDEPRATVELKSTVEDKKYVGMCARGQWIAGLSVRFGCRPDSHNRHMAATLANFAVWSEAERSPLFRLEYLDDMRGAPPACHWQVHAERGALSHLLTLSAHRDPTRLSALHLPVGGARMRPALEDFIHFVIVELGADHTNDWEAVIGDSRETWRRRQIRALVRDVPSAAIAELVDLGYKVTPEAAAFADDRTDVLREW